MEKEALPDTHWSLIDTLGPLLGIGDPPLDPGTLTPGGGPPRHDPRLSSIRI